MIEHGLGFSLVPGNRPSSVNSAGGLRDCSAGALGASALWDQSTPNSHSSTNVYARALRLHRKDCFRAQTPLRLQRQTGNDRPEIVATALVRASGGLEQRSQLRRPSHGQR
jgi:hypothetical protein